MTARSKDPGARAPKEEVPLSVDPAVREFVIASAVAKYASFLRAHCSGKRSRSRVDLSGSGYVRTGFWRRRPPNIFDITRKFGGHPCLTITLPMPECPMAAVPGPQLSQPS